MEFYDALVYLGRRRGLEDFRYSTVESLSKTLDKYGISKATVVSFMCEYPSVDQGNERVFAAADRDDRVSPAPAVLPNVGLEVGDEAEHVDRLIERGARCVCFYPETHGTTLDDRVVGPLFAALNERRLPILLFETDWLEAAELAGRYPQVPVIIPIARCRNRTWLAAL
ncbi:MAG: hypothetical protein J7M14_06350, partial [Planctomycetes bacterium]|nr:hypothetical protein [Planctomycetota bacterium]